MNFWQFWRPQNSKIWKIRHSNLYKIWIFMILNVQKSWKSNFWPIKDQSHENWHQKCLKIEKRVCFKIERLCFVYFSQFCDKNKNKKVKNIFWTFSVKFLVKNSKNSPFRTMVKAKSNRSKLDAQDPAIFRTNSAATCGFFYVKILIFVRYRYEFRPTTFPELFNTHINWL